MAKTKKIILPEFIPNTVRMYLDGSAITSRHDPRCFGGWGVYLTSEYMEDSAYSGGAENTTVSRMEMTAMDYALGLTIKLIENGVFKPVHIYSDSQFVVRSINLGWLHNWVREKFIGRPNSDIWIPIWDKIVKLRRLKADYNIHHISGHQKNLDNPHVFGNNVADLLADYKQYI